VENVWVVVRRTGIKRMVRMHPAFGAGQLVQHHVRRGGGRVGVRHFEHGGDAAEHRRARSGLKVFLPFEARFTEVDLCVDHPGQHVKAIRLEDFTRLGGSERANVGDLPVQHADIRNVHSARRRHRPALDDQVECLRHRQLQECCRCMDPERLLAKPQRRFE